MSVSSLASQQSPTPWTLPQVTNLPLRCSEGQENASLGGLPEKKEETSLSQGKLSSNLSGSDWDTYPFLTSQGAVLTLRLE